MEYRQFTRSSVYYTHRDDLEKREVQMRVSARGRWMRGPSYGRAITSVSARYTARYYRLIIGAMVVALMLLQATHTTAPIQILTGLSVAFYGAYLIGRLLMPERWEQHYYTPRNQFWRAQVAILGVTSLLAMYAMEDQFTILWILYILALMIVSEHCSTRSLLLAVLEIAFSLVILGYFGSRLALISYLALSAPFMEASSKAASILLLAFLLHYLIRNVEARDTSIGRYRSVLNSLTANLPNSHNPQTSKGAVLDMLRRSCTASSGSIWIVEPNSGRLTLNAYADADGVITTGDPSLNHCLFHEPIPLGDDCLPACVARNGRPGYAVTGNRTPGNLDDARPTGRTVLPSSKMELAIPIPVFETRQAHAHAVLLLSFNRSMRSEEMLQEYRSTAEVARYLSPLFFYTSLIEQTQALQYLQQTIANSLDQDRILATLLQIVVDLFHFDFAAVWLVDELDGSVRFAHSVGGASSECIGCGARWLNSASWKAETTEQLTSESSMPWSRSSDGLVWKVLQGENQIAVIMPMTVDDPASEDRKCVGFLQAGYLHAHDISENQMHLLRPFLDLAGVAMANAYLYQQARFKADALTVLQEGGQACLSALWSPGELLVQIGRNAESVLRADLVLLYGYDDERGQAELLYCSDTLFGDRKPTARLGQGNILDALIQRREGLFFSDAAHEPLLTKYSGANGKGRRTFAQCQKVISFAGLPLVTADRLVGMMCLNFRSRRSFSADERLVAQLLAQQAASALESARLHESDRQLAVSRERASLSRELHHSISHDLFAIVLKARTIMHHVSGTSDAHPPETAYHRIVRELQHILEIGEGANRHLGYLLSEYSTSPTGCHDFRDYLAKMVERIERYFDLQVHFRGTTDRELPPRIHFALSRIGAEALNNVIHHSQCQHATIVCCVHNGQLSLEITDDGVGFDVARALERRHGQGLENMHTYAKQMEATLRIESSVGTGTGTKITLRADLSRIGESDP